MTDTTEWKCGNEFLPYHPSASHVDPSYRDGWNACYQAARASQAAPPPVAGWLTDEQRKDLLAASFCVAMVGDPSATMKPEDAERVIELLGALAAPADGRAK